MKSKQAILKDLGMRFKFFRKLKGLSLRELGLIINKDPQSINRVEMGNRNPSYFFMREICESLEVELSTVLDKKF